MNFMIILYTPEEKLNKPYTDQNSSTYSLLKSIADEFIHSLSESPHTLSSANALKYNQLINKKGVFEYRTMSMSCFAYKFHKIPSNRQH